MTAPWLFRVAARPEDGGGHLARTLALARALARHRPVVFVLDRGADGAARRVAAAGFPAVCEGEEPSAPLAGALLDGYCFTREDAARWKMRTGRLVVIEDLQTPPPEADLVVDPMGGVPSAGEAHVLSGPAYALLDPVFAALPARPTPARVDRLLVSFGLTDSLGATGLALEALARLRDRGLSPRVTVALGEGAPHLAAVRGCVAAVPGWELVVGAASLAPLLAEADMAVGAGGVGLMERLAAGVPSVTVPVADNQRAPVARAAAAGATLAADGQGGRDLDVGRLADAVAVLAGDAERRARMAACGRALVDGDGAGRVAAAMLALERSTAAGGAAPVARARR